MIDGFLLFFCLQFGCCRDTTSTCSVPVHLSLVSCICITSFYVTTRERSDSIRPDTRIANNALSIDAACRLFYSLVITVVTRRFVPVAAIHEFALLRIDVDASVDASHEPNLECGRSIATRATEKVSDFQKWV